MRSPLILTDDHPLRPEASDWARKAYSEDVQLVFWHRSSHTEPADRPCVIVLAGASVSFPVSIGTDSRCLVTFGAGLPEISPDGLEMTLAFRDEHTGATEVLSREHVVGFDPDTPWHEQEVDLAHLAGRQGAMVVTCSAGPEMDCRADWLALYELVVSSRDELTLQRARAFPRHRKEVELAVFSAAYRHELYSSPRAEERAIPQSQEEHDAVDPMGGGRTTGRGALPGENLTTYYVRRLGEVLELDQCDYNALLAKRARLLDRPVRILSLASGAARIEEMFIEGLDPSRVDLTLTDLNPDLLSIAQHRLRSKARVSAEVVDLNKLSLPADPYDVIMCVSALHHVVELEQLVDTVAGALREDGELWSIGEYIGRNGSRLYPDAYEIANQFFSGLPSSYRRNRSAGCDGRVDEKLSNADCSATCFEGIRSEELLGVLESRFRVIDAARSDCFLWRLFGLPYWANYDLASEADVGIIERAIRLDTELMSRGGQPVSMTARFAAIA